MFHIQQYKAMFIHKYVAIYNMCVLHVFIVFCIGRSNGKTVLYMPCMRCQVVAYDHYTALHKELL